MARLVASQFICGVMAVTIALARRVAGRWYLLVSALLAAQVVGIAPAPASASTPSGKPFVAFGPVDYVRQAGPPQTVTATFTLLNPAAPYILSVANGGLGGQYGRASSGTITLNGTPVVVTSDFNQTVAAIDKTVTPALSNQLTIDLRSSPGAGITLQVIGFDNDPPTITASASPAPNAAGWNNTPVTVTFTCADKTSGVETCASPVTVTTEGANQVVSGTATDKAGNTASTAITINLDKTAPTTSVTAPTSGAALNTKAPTLTATATDALSGVASVQFQISADNGATWTNIGSPLTTPPYQATVTSPLSDGMYQVRTLVTDMAGNQGTSPTVAFLIDTTPPTVSITQPVPNAITNSRTLAASAADSGSGVASVQFQLSSDKGTTWTNVGAAVTTAPYQLSLPTSQADGSYDVRAQAVDNAGNRGTSPSVAFTLETTAPHTTITAHPDASTSQTSATLAFSADQPGVTFECQLDNAAFSACTSPQTYGNLSVGNHTFAVRGTDPAGNVEAAPATFRWTITSTLPAGSGSAIVGSAGGTVTTPDGAASVSLPSGAVPDGTLVQIVPIASGALPEPGGSTTATRVYDFRDVVSSGAPLTDFGQPCKSPLLTRADLPRLWPFSTDASG